MKRPDTSDDGYPRWSIHKRQTDRYLESSLKYRPEMVRVAREYYGKCIPMEIIEARDGFLKFGFPGWYLLKK